MRYRLLNFIALSVNVQKILNQREPFVHPISVLQAFQAKYLFKNFDTKGLTVGTHILCSQPQVEVFMQNNVITLVVITILPTQELLTWHNNSLVTVMA